MPRPWTRCSGPNRFPNSSGAVTTPLVAETNVFERNSTGKASTAAAVPATAASIAVVRSPARPRCQSSAARTVSRSGPSHGAIARPSTSSAAAIATATDASRHSPAARPATISGTSAISSASAQTVAISLIDPCRLYAKTSAGCAARKAIAARRKRGRTMLPASS